MTPAVRVLIAIVLGILLVACMNPRDRRPGLWLSGEVATELPEDWSFTDAHAEIAIEVRPPYWLRHSVTIWCGSLDGDLYVGARAPETKRWPGWADRNPDVRLLIDGLIYEVRLEPLDETEVLGRVGRVYAAKYELPELPPEGAPSFRYWRVMPRG